MVSPAELKASEEKVAVAEKRLHQMAEKFEHRRDRALDRAAAMNKWLLASLLALNGAAMLALKDSTLASAPGARQAFLIGIVLAVLSGLAAQIEGELIGEHSAKVHDGLLDYFAGRSLEETVKKLPRSTFLINVTIVAAPLCIALSLFAFVKGASLATSITPLLSPR